MRMEKSKPGNCMDMMPGGGSERSRSSPTEKSGGGTDYRNSRAPLRHILPALLICGVVFLGLGWLFFRSLTAGIIMQVFLPLMAGPVDRFLRKRRLELLERQFIDGMRSFAAALRAGFSPENGLGQAIPEISRIYGDGAMLAEEFGMIRRRLEIDGTMEEGLKDLADRSGIDDIREMAAVFAIAKRTGGNLPGILMETVHILEEKRRTKAEIQTMITAKKLEHRVMCLMPAGILIYLNLTGPEFVDPLYEGLRGRLIMIGCLAVYAFAVWLGEKMMQVEL